MTAGLALERLTSPTGIPEILAIDRATFSVPWTREMYECELQNSQSFVIVGRGPDGTAQGYCSFWIVLDEVHINNVAVLSAFTRRGVGTALVAYALEAGRQRGATAATLEVRRSNTAARNLYARLGFEERGVRHRYYSNPDDDALVLWAAIGAVDAAGAT